jgi:flagellar motor switch protein FliM
VLCEHPEEKPAPRNLTAVEMELSQLILDTFAGALSEAWPEKDPLTCQLGAIDLAPHRSRLFVGTEFMIVMNFSIKALAGNVIFQWALPRAVTAKALEPFIEKQVAQPTHNPRDSVQQIPIEVVFNLGKANLSMTDLTRLQVGDIIVLDQRVDEPVVGTMDDKPLYKGWPGRIGADQVFKISRIIT